MDKRLNTEKYSNDFIVKIAENLTSNLDRTRGQSEERRTDIIETWIIPELECFIRYSDDETPKVADCLLFADYLREKAEKYKDLAELLEYNVNMGWVKDLSEKAKGD